MEAIEKPRLRQRIANSSNISGHKGVMTASKLAAAIEAGHGQGRNEEYWPWLRVRRRLSSPVSNLLVVPTPVHKRPLHLLARTEFAAALVGCWLGAKEVREQLPMWIQAHPHPNSSPLRAALGQDPMVRGLLEIAEELGIRHGVYPGTRLPYIGTVDLVLNFERQGMGAEHQRQLSEGLVFWPCKPAGLLKDGVRGAPRRLERLRLDEAYANECGGFHALIDGTQFSKELVANLDWMMPLHSEWMKYGESACLQEFAACCDQLLSRLPIREAVQTADNTLGVSDQKLSWLLFRMGVWVGKIDVDLSRPILTTRLAQRGGIEFKQRLSLLLTGASSWTR